MKNKVNKKTFYYGTQHAWINFRMFILVEANPYFPALIIFS